MTTTKLEQMTAVTIFGKLFTGTQEEFGAALVEFISGNLDEALVDFNVAQGNDENVVRANIEDHKNRFRNQIMEGMEELLKQGEEEAIQSTKRLHAPSKNGTTAEIAAHLNISKSEVRKLRREGKLDEVFEESL